MFVMLQIIKILEKCDKIVMDSFKMLLQEYKDNKINFQQVVNEIDVVFCIELRENQGDYLKRVLDNNTYKAAFRTAQALQ